MDVPKVDILFILGNGAHVVRAAELKEPYPAVNVDALAAAFQPFYTVPIDNSNTGNETDTKNLSSSRFPSAMSRINLTDVRISHFLPSTALPYSEPIAAISPADNQARLSTTPSQ